MNKYLTQALGLCVTLAVVTTACKKDEVQAVVTPSNQPTLTASTSIVVLSQANADQTAITFTWTPVKSSALSGTDKSATPPMTYQLQFAKPGTNFAKPVSIDAGAGPTTAVKVSDLNGALQTLGLTSGTAGQAEVRLNANYAPNFIWASPSVALTVTTYTYCGQPALPKAWSVIGAAAKGWGTDVIMTYDCASDTYTYTGSFLQDEYKFRYGGDDPVTGKWKTNLGGTSSTGGALVQDGPNLQIPAAGTYTLTLKPGAIGADGKVAGGMFTIK